MQTLRKTLEPHIRKIGTREVSQRIGIAHSSLCHWLAGQRGFSDEKIDRLISALKLKTELKERKK